MPKCNFNKVALQSSREKGGVILFFIAWGLGAIGSNVLKFVKQHLQTQQ